MTALNWLLLGIWLVWAAGSLWLRVDIGRLRESLRDIDFAQAEVMQFRQGSMNFLEPFQWYLRVRRFVRSPSSSAFSAATTVLRGKTARLMTCVELLTLVLIVLVCASVLIAQTHR